MNAQEHSSRTPIEPSATTPNRRPPPKAICVLLPVWGDEYIYQFLEHSLPTLLASGNIPALAKALPTRFVFLTRTGDEAILRPNAAFVRLREACAVEILAIDDLITRGNHSTTITLAYVRAVRQAGEEMLDTCFFFLVSDYVMADGSMAAVLARMQAGASAVQVGNFQLDEEYASDLLPDAADESGAPITLTPREMMRWSLDCLHPLTAANIVNFPLCHNTHANRFLWQVDNNTLIGRFYLLHMICVRPETTEFVIGSSCDYSFVPEMCPSDNIETITDSDEYLVVEIQPHDHESHFLRLGPASIDEVARGLSEWTTARHRANAERTIIFHAGPLPPSFPAALAEAETYIQELTLRCHPEPQPHRNHPYWLGAIAAFDAAILRRESGTSPPRRTSIGSLLLRQRQRFFGRAPEVTRAHPRWQDYAVPLAVCTALSADSSLRLLIGASRATALTDWLRQRVPSAVNFSPHRLRRRPLRGVKPGSFDVAFVELVDREIAEINEHLRRIAPLVRSGGKVFVVAQNQQWNVNPELVGRGIAEGLASVISSGLRPVEYHICSVSRFRWFLNSAGIAVVRSLLERRTILFPLHLLGAAVLLPLMTGVNVVSSWKSNRASHRRIASSVFVRFQVINTPPDRLRRRVSEMEPR